MLPINPADVATRLGDPAPPITSVCSLSPEAKPNLGSLHALPAPSQCTGRITVVARVVAPPASSVLHT